ncbi:MAG: hypothetical protein HWQ35_11710 [Nostoc sp. NMS1]|uniref:hypothetical protein n=1 Tax=unclassified Nostoc TaxID=2593658 RepID=UPI0025D72CEB|nr:MULTISPECIES: hypothetical protein [unclassified Nostoc]MBN3907195.1 hypothetical protein [Nostoc sp. NMS1]MBN3989812.1 hypothetical protein [Nostoc sp. NMS2]
MFYGQIERECLYGENWIISQKSKLPDHLQLLVDQEEVECDIWELQSQEPDDKPIYSNINQAYTAPRRK